MADEPADRLSRINTMWTLVHQANQPGSRRSDALEILLERYQGAVYRYLLGAVRDPAVAEELLQVFALRFIEGKLHGANADKPQSRLSLRERTFFRGAKDDFLVPQKESHEPAAQTRDRFHHS